MYTLEQVEKRVNKKTGLVPLKITKPFNPYPAGTIAGFPPTIAVQHLNNQLAEFASSKDKMPTAPVNAPAPVPGGVLASGTKYDGKPEISPLAQVAPNTAQAPSRELEKADIPEDWKSFTSGQKRSLAANLSGRTYQELSVADAEKIIEEAIAGNPPPATGGAADVDPAGTRSDETGATGGDK